MRFAPAARPRPWTALLVCLGALVLPGVAFAQTGPPTLAGEQFTSVGQSTVTARSCDAAGATFSFSASGIADGPYIGPFEESGTVSASSIRYVGPLFVAGPITSFQATFTIQTPEGTVTGTKEIVTSSPAFALTCATQPVPFDAFNIGAADASYTACITTADGRFGDSGLANVTFSVLDQYGVNDFGESFFGTRGATAQPGCGADTTPAAVVVSPATATNPVGTSHTVTAAVSNAGGQTLAGVTVLFTVSGIVSAAGSCTTDATGVCSYTFPGPLFPGVAAITGCADANGNGAIDPGEPCGSATKTFALPVSTPGKTTGGGQFLHATGGTRANFGITFRSTDALDGNCTIDDAVAGVTVRCLDVLAYAQTGADAVIYGNATVNGIATLYRIEVADGGEGEGATDVFTIATASGYSAGGPVTQGNVQVH